MRMERKRGSPWALGSVSARECMTIIRGGAAEGSRLRRKVELLQEIHSSKDGTSDRRGRS